MQHPQALSLLTQKHRNNIEYRGGKPLAYKWFNTEIKFNTVGVELADAQTPHLKRGGKLLAWYLILQTKKATQASLFNC